MSSFTRLRDAIRHSVVLAVLCGAFIIASAENGRSQEVSALSDAEARQLILAEWEGYCYKFPIGQIRIVQRPGQDRFPDWTGEDRVLSRYSIRLIEFAAQAGMISIEERHDLAEEQEESFSWDKFGRQTRGEVGTVSLAARDEMVDFYMNEEEMISRDLVCVVMSDYSIQEIIDNSVIEENASTYRLVRGTHEIDHHEHARLYYELSDEWRAGIHSDIWDVEERKFRVLLKYNVFEGDWQFIKGDYAARQGEFSESIAEFLEQ